MASLNTLSTPKMTAFARSFLQLVERALHCRSTLTSVGRDRDDQVRIWERCMRGESRFPAAYPGSSPHEQDIAFDVKLEPPGPLVEVEGRMIGRNYAIAGLMWERLGFRWGGRFRDEIHFDFHPRGFVPAGHPRSCRP